jgi:hypothetical protein
MVKNELNNFARAMNDGRIIELKNQAKGLNAVMLGAGSSLSQFAPILSQNRGYALYASALQTLPALQRFDLKPHLCVVLDCSDHIIQLYDSLDLDWCNDIVLIYSTTANHKVVEKYPGPTLPLWTLGGIGTNIFQGKEIILNAGGIVGLTLLRLLHLFGVDQVLFVGYDFAWSGEYTHARGHLASSNEFHFNPKNHRRISNKNGETIFSTVQLQAALRATEDEIEASNIRAFNLYGGGVVIKGAREMTLEQAQMQGLLTSKPENLEHFRMAIENARKSKSRCVFEARSSKWAITLRSGQKRIEKLFKKAGKKQNEIHNTLKNILFFVQHDPVYNAYLFNEILELKGLVHARIKYNLKDLGLLRSILKRVLKKVREIDRFLR